MPRTQPIPVSEVILTGVAVVLVVVLATLGTWPP